MDLHAVHSHMYGTKGKSSAKPCETGLLDFYYCSMLHSALTIVVLVGGKNIVKTPLIRHLR